MKGIATSIVITIIFVVLVIFIIVAYIPITKEFITILSCKNDLNEILDKIKYESCEMNDMDLEYIEKLGTSCVDKIIYKSDEKELELSLKLKKEKKYIYDVSCPQGFYDYVFFDFSLAGDKEELKIKEKSYSFLISPKKAKLVFCQGLPNDCEDFNNENECKKQLGCYWNIDSKACLGDPKSCYDLKEEECQKQKGCEPL